MATLNLGRIKPVFRGAYAGGTAYVVDDIVTSGNETFICILASTGNATSNATYWTKLAAKGTDGTDLAATLTTQGDVAYRGASAIERLGFGTSGYFLKTQGTGANPVWAEAGGGGLLQLKQVQITDDTSRNSLTFGEFDADFRCIITPTLSTSKILVSTTFQASSDNYAYFRLIREVSSSDTIIAQPDTEGSSRQHGMVGNVVYNTDGSTGGTIHMEWLDAPATTSAITYKVYSAGHATVYFQRGRTDSDGTSSWRSVATLTAKEIAVGVL